MAVKTYYSKKGFVIYIPLIILVIIEGTYMFTGQYITGLICLALMCLIFLPIFFRTYYTITPENLYIKCGLFFGADIAIDHIYKIEDTRTILCSPALSLDRIEIFYNKFDSIIVSPENKSEFIAQLQSINPAVVYQPKKIRYQL